MDLDNEQPGSRWKFLFTWPSLLMLGLLVYEFTSEASLGAAILSIKFGLEDFRTAFWIRRRDTNRSRGRACFWLYLSWGLFKTAVTGFVMMLVIAGIAGMAGAKRGPAPREFIVAALTAAFGFLTCGLAGAWALWCGLRSGQKLWLNSALHGARRGDLWPPPADCLGYENRASGITWTMLFVVGFTVACILLVALGFIFFGGQQPPAPALILMVAIGTIVAPAVAILFGADLIRSRLLAKHPLECWPLGCETTTDHGP